MRASRSQLCPRSFLNQNYDVFLEETWDMPLDADSELGFEAKKHGFRSIVEMMRVFFDKAPWRYRHLLIAFAVRTQPDDSCE